MARLLHVTTFYPPHSFGGDAQAVRSLAQHLAAEGHQVAVAHLPQSHDLLTGEPRPRQDADGPVQLFPLNLASPRTSLLIMQQTGSAGPVRQAFHAILDRFRPDLIHFHNVSLFGGPEIFSLGDTPKLLTMHDHWLVCAAHVLFRNGQQACTQRSCFVCQLRHYRPPQLWRYTDALARHLRQVSRLIAPSEFSRRKHLELGIDRHIDVIPHFVENPVIPVADTAAAPYFLMSGRLERMKGFHEVIAAFRRTDWPVGLRIIGHGSQRDALRQLAAGDPRIHFHDWCDPLTLRQHAAGAVAQIVPSLTYETFGLIVAEAAVLGVPSVVRNLGALPELIDGGAGLSFDTLEQLFVHLRHLLDDRDWRNQLGQAALAKARRHWTWHQHYAQYSRLCDDVSSTPQPAATR